MTKDDVMDMTTEQIISAVTENTVIGGLIVSRIISPNGSTRHNGVEYDWHDVFGEDYESFYIFDDRIDEVYKKVSAAMKNLWVTHPCPDCGEVGCWVTTEWKGESNGN